MADKLLTRYEAAKLLDISVEEFDRLVASGKVPAYNIGGEFIRFKRDQIERFRVSNSHPRSHSPPHQLPNEVILNHNWCGGEHSNPLFERIIDFLYFNDFYIISISLIVGIIFFIFRS